MESTLQTILGIRALPLEKMKVSQETIENLEKVLKQSRFSEICQVKTTGLRNRRQK
jgi:hypothetical protein